MSLVASVLPWWSVLFISEADAFHDDRLPHDCTHACFRHYPGAGSLAMVFAIRRDWGPLVKSCKWRGRCGAIHLQQHFSPHTRGVNFFIIGVHGAHGALLADTICDVAHLARHRPFGSQVILLGDWNVDLLPSLLRDPWADVGERAQHHRHQRLLLEAFAEGHGFEIHVPSMCCSVPGGPFGEHCSQTPISRIPTGETHIHASRAHLISVSRLAAPFLKRSYIGIESRLIMPYLPFGAHPLL